MKEIRRSAEFGITVKGGYEVNFGEVMKRMRKLRAQIAPADSYEGAAAVGVDVYQGRATFTGYVCFVVR